MSELLLLQNIQLSGMMVISTSGVVATLVLSVILKYSLVIG
jgi:hypothetical protein